MRKHLTVLSHMPAKLWLRAIWHSIHESSLRVEFTQWKKRSVCLLSACSWKVLTWHLKLQSSIYIPENRHEILNHFFSIPISLFPNSHLKISAFFHRLYFPPFLIYLPTLFNTDDSNSEPNCLRKIWLMLNLLHALAYLIGNI